MKGRAHHILKIPDFIQFYLKLKFNLRIKRTKCEPVKNREELDDKWSDFGNHTGFKEIEKECSNLVVDEWYSLTYKNGLYTLKSESGKLCSSINGFKIGYEFKESGAHSAYRFENFFLSRKQVRELRLEKILNKNE